MTFGAEFTHQNAVGNQRSWVSSSVWKSYLLPRMLTRGELPVMSLMIQLEPLQPVTIHQFVGTSLYSVHQEFSGHPKSRGAGPNRRKTTRRGSMNLGFQKNGRHENSENEFVISPIGSMRLEYLQYIHHTWIL